MTPNMTARLRRFFTPLNRVLMLLICCVGTSAHAADNSAAMGAYKIEPGDILQVSVWKEEDLTKSVIVRPDGQISFPLVGEASAAGNTLEAVRKQLADKLSKYIPDPVVTVSIEQLSGNIIYVIGKVNRPGQFPILRNVDVMQALSMAGGTSTYASLNKIKILRRNGAKLTAIPFEYGDVEKGNNLEQNIILKAGDVVVVP
jgi:polysaccharide export outer membrane protein